MEFGIIFICIFIIGYLISQTLKYRKEKNLFKLVAWSVTGNYDTRLNINSYTSELVSYIKEAQYINKIDNEYKTVESDEIKIVYEIIKEYQKYVSREYFKGHLGLIDSKRTIQPEDYFMATLHDLLSAHHCDRTFIEYDMFGEQFEYKRYSDGSGYKATYALTDFSIVYHKLYYITHIYCKNSLALQDKVSLWSEEIIKEALDTKQMTIIG